jgi:hypothetical protein
MSYRRGGAILVLFPEIIVTDNLATIFENEIDRAIGHCDVMGAVDNALRHTLALKDARWATASGRLARQESLMAVDCTRRPTDHALRKASGRSHPTRHPRDSRPVARNA